jgi:adenine-specific DNA-methyltransferase
MASLTPYHAKYYAHELTRRWPSDSVEKFARALVDARVHLNPHQVEAALFAFKSPLSKGALLADEVGLGKTIEAGLLISQRWAERKRRILIIAPANLRKQWHQEMAEKFFLPCHILEAKSFNAALKAGKGNPFEVPEIVICSYQFAAGKELMLRNVPWDLVVIDEAHRLRNVWKPDNKTANKLKNALVGTPKVLLTATPLQNSLMELYGLVSFIDEQVFNDDKSFREQFSSVKEDDVFQNLKARLKPVCHRTLRRQVLNVKFTARHPLVEEFITSEKEDELYELVSGFAQGPARAHHHGVAEAVGFVHVRHCRCAGETHRPLGKCVGGIEAEGSGRRTGRGL